MRIESLVSYKYYFRFIEEEALYTKPYSLLLFLLIPIFVIYCLSGWNPSFLLFVVFAYSCAAIGYFVAYKSEIASLGTAKKKVFQNIISENSEDIILVKSKGDKHISFANPAFYKFFKLEKKAGRKHWFYEIIEAQDLHFFSEKNNRFRVQILPSQHPIIKIKKPDGIIAQMALSIQSIENGNYTIYKLRDCTEQLLREQANRQLTRDLLQRKSQKQKSVIAISQLERLALKI